MQMAQVRKRMENDGQFEDSNEAIAFSIHKPKKKKSSQKYSYNEMEEIQSTGVYLSQREVAKRINISPGSYIIRPTVYNSEGSLKFFLRIFIESESSQSNDNIQVKFLKTVKASEMFKNSRSFKGVKAFTVFDVLRLLQRLDIFENA